VPKSSGMSSNGFGMADPFAAARSLNGQPQPSGPPQNTYPAAWHNAGPATFPASGSMGVMGQAPAPAPFHSPPATFPTAPKQQQSAPYGQQPAGSMQGAFGGFAPSGQSSNAPGMGFEQLARYVENQWLAYWGGMLGVVPANLKIECTVICRLTIAVTPLRL
jgi:hypothetical protein